MFEANFNLSQREVIEATFEINPTTKEHNQLSGRDLNNCHPISAITGLQEALDNAGQVKDVEVDGQSVVNQDGVAEIDLTGKQDVIEDLDEIRAGATLGETAVQPSELSAVATSGNYNDLNNKPTIGNATLTIQKNGTSVDTFTANATSDKTINITVPTKPSDIGAATSAQGALADTALQPSDITTGSTNGTIAVSGTDVSVYGLGSAAYTPSTDYATAAQGSLADNALQPSDVVNNTTSTATNAPLSANMGKSLQTQIDNLNGRGRYLALWNCATGLAQSNPPQSPYTYKAGDYFIVGTVATGSGTNYKPTGSSYTTGVASTVVESEAVAVNDVYYYDGTSWSLQINTQKEVAFVNIVGSPYDNTSLASALNAKQNTINDLETIRSGAALGATAVQPSALSGYVPTSRTVNSKALSSNITLTSDDIEYTTAGTTCTYVFDLFLTAMESLGDSIGGSFDEEGTFSKASYKPSGSSTLNNISDTDEITAAIGLCDKSIGKLTSLTTTSKTDCVSAINEVKGAIPTNNNQLTNGAGYITSSALSGYATENYVDTAISESVIFRDWTV